MSARSVVCRFSRAIATIACCLMGAVFLSHGAYAADISWKEVTRQSASWYGSPEAARIAGNVLQYQMANGGWGKNLDMTQPPSATDKLAMQKGGDHGATIDNGATYTQLRFLALINQAVPSANYTTSFNRGLDYLLGFQYPNGGWQQFYPPRPGGYWTHITYNDDAMIGVLSLLRDIAHRKAPFAFVDAARRERARQAIIQGEECLLRTQVVVKGKKTAWCQQHDEKTFAPAWGRKFEPPSLCTAESIGIVRYLMAEENPSPQVQTAIEAAITWLRMVRIDGLRVSRKDENGKKGIYVTTPDPKAPPIWARMYEIDTNRPIFCGRDSVIKYSVAEIEPERSAGYAWYGDWGKKLLEQEYPGWKARIRNRPSHLRRGSRYRVSRARPGVVRSDAMCSMLQQATGRCHHASRKR